MQSFQNSKVTSNVLSQIALMKQMLQQIQSSFQATKNDRQKLKSQISTMRNMIQSQQQDTQNQICLKIKLLSDYSQSIIKQARNDNFQIKQSNIKNKNILNGFDKRICKLDEIVEGDNYQ